MKLKSSFYFFLDTINDRVYLISNNAGRLAQFNDKTLGPFNKGLYDDQKWRIVMEPSKPGFFYIINYFRGFFIIKHGAGFNEVSAPDASKTEAGLWRLSLIDNPICIASITYFINHSMNPNKQYLQIQHCHKTLSKVSKVQ